MHPSLTQILCNKRPTTQEEKMCKAHEQTTHSHKHSWSVCYGEGSSSPVFKNVNSNLKGQKNAQYL